MPKVPQPITADMNLGSSPQGPQAVASKGLMTPVGNLGSVQAWVCLKESLNLGTQSSRGDTAGALAERAIKLLEDLGDRV